MSARAAAWLAWSLCALALGLLALQLIVILLGSMIAPPRGDSTWPGQAFVALGLAGAPILGGLLAARQPRNPYGWVWLGFATGWAISSFAETYTLYTRVAEPAALLPDPRVVNAVAGPGWLAGTFLLPFLFLLFPDGRLPSRRWRVVAWAVAVLGVFATILYIASSIGFAEEIAPNIGDGFFYLSQAALALSVFSLVVRYRSASGVERQQIKWFAYAAGGVGLIELIGLLDPWALVGIAWWYLLIAAGFTGLYAAVGIAVLKYRLYDIDLVINRTLVYGALTMLLALVYLGGVAALQTILRSLTGQDSQLAVVASTLAIAALFNPLRGRIQAFMDRRFYRRKYDARKTLEAFSAKLRDETDLDSLSKDLTGVVLETMQPAHASLWLRVPVDVGRRKGSPGRATAPGPASGNIPRSSTPSASRPSAPPGARAAGCR